MFCDTFGELWHYLSGSVTWGKVVSCIRSGKLHRPPKEDGLNLPYQLLQPTLKSQKSSSWQHILKNDVFLTGCAYFGCIQPSRLKRPESHRWTRDKHKNLPIRKHSEGKLMHFEQAWREQGLHNCLLPRSWMLPELKNEITIPDHPSTWCICVCSLPWGEKKYV